MKQKIYFPLAITLVIACAVLLLVVFLGLQYKYIGCCLSEPSGQSSEQITEDESTDCKTDLDCFIKASESCNQAKVTYAETTNVFGIVQTTTLFFEIKGIEEDKCILYIRDEKNDLKLSDETIQQMLAGGATQERIQEQEQRVNEYADLVEGIDGLCKFNTNDLTSMLDKWKAGNFSTDDWNVAECSGKMFEQ